MGSQMIGQGWFTVSSEHIYFIPVKDEVVEVS